MQDYKLWCTYHREDIPEEYNLYETNNFKLFYNDNFNLEEDNINYLHDYLCDIGTYYYIWKNNLKSDIVGFCQYSKHFRFINYDLLNNFGFQSYEFDYINSNDFCNDIITNTEASFLYRSLITYLKLKYNIDFFKYIDKHQYILLSWHNMYFFTWDTFCDVCDFVFGLLDYMCPNNSWKIKSNLDFIVKVKGDICLPEAKGDYCWWPKYLSVWFETAIGLYLGIKYTNNIKNEYNKYLLNTPKYFVNCIDYIDNIELLKKWLKKNFKSGITQYIIKSQFSTNELNEEFEKNTDINNSSIINLCVYRLDTYKTDEEFNTRINELKNDFNYNQISLHINEYIDCNNSIEMHNDKYKIKKIN